MKIRVSGTTKAMVLGLMIAGASTAAADHNFTGEVKDAWIQGKVETVLALNGEVSAFAINTGVEHGAVVLQGEVETEIDKELAARLARGVEGVESIDNQLTVTGPDRDRSEIARETDQATDRIANSADRAGDNIEREWDEATDEIEDEVDDRDLADRAKNTGNSLMTWVSDATTTASVKTKLLANSETEGLKIDVDTSNDIVTLSGEVKTEEEKMLAEQIARETGDVQRVENNLVVTARLSSSNQ